VYTLNGVHYSQVVSIDREKEPNNVLIIDMHRTLLTKLPKDRNISDNKTSAVSQLTLKQCQGWHVSLGRRFFPATKASI